MASSGWEAVRMTLCCGLLALFVPLQARDAVEPGRGEEADGGTQLAE